MKSLRTNPRLGGLVFAVSIVVMSIRHPECVIDPTLFAEEGAVAFENAWLASPARALVTPYGGYYSAIANVATLLSVYIVPLEFAPFVTMTCALLISQLPVVLILSSRAEFFSLPATRYGSVLAVVLLSGFPPSTVYSMVYLTAAAFLALLEETCPGEPRRRCFLARAVLLLAGVGSPMTGFLLPVVGLMAIRRRHMRPAAWFLFGGVAIQAFAFAASFSFDARTAYVDFLFIPPVVLLDLLDGVVPAHLLGWLHDWSYAMGHRGDLQKWLQAVIATGLLVVVWRFIFAVLPRSVAPLFLGSLVALGVLTTCLGGNLLENNLLVRTPPRYTFGTNMILLLTLVSAMTSRGVRRGAAQPVGCAILFLSALVAAFDHGRRASDRSPHVSWRDEVGAWRRDPEHMIRIRPQGWTVLLRETPPGVVFTTKRCGEPTGETPGLPRLGIREIRLGHGVKKTVGEILSARPFAKGVVIMTWPGPESLFDLGDGQRGLIYLDMARGTLMRFDFRTDGQGRWQRSLRAREFSQYVGLTLRAQALITEPVRGLTNAIDITIDRR
jgi:hypothetical protein